ncbi:HAD family phosphatase [Treponema sp.]|uniref:HAD family hydrolase n=1 Tax=Treponema sp. TaxID=166 RepID=UPI00298E98AD|nr:HAD family phosphatase [Treponema sp.]MCR5614064.1 HAD family phosphatase [Treponema sp.]
MLFIFDMGGVVTTTFKMNELYKKIGITQEEFKEICCKKRKIFDELEKGQINSSEFWAEFNKAAKSHKIQPVEHDLFRLYFHPVLNTETVKIINSLKKKHRVVCGTNTIQSHWENHMERGDYAFFDQTYASNKIGEAKPDPQFFKVILEAEGYKPEDAFFVDDKIENVKAAQSVGINAVQFTTAAELKKEWKKWF